MKIRMDRLRNAVNKVTSELGLKDFKDAKDFIVDVSVVEADLNKGIPATVLVITIQYDKADYYGKMVRHSLTMEVFDEMDNTDPSLTHVHKTTIES